MRSTFRFGETEAQHLTEFQAKNKLKTRAKALNLLIQDHQNLEAFFAVKDIDPNDPALKCYRRMKQGIKLYCVTTPVSETRGLPSKTLLPSIVVCSICRETRMRRLGVKLENIGDIERRQEKKSEPPKPEPPKEKPLLCPMTGEPFQPDPNCIQCQKAHLKDWHDCEARRYWRATRKLTVTVEK